MTESISFTSIGQISRTVSDVNAAANWFEIVLEVPHLYTFGSLAFFDCGGTRLMLTEEEQLNKNESLLYFKVTNIEKAYSTLQEKGVEFINAPHKVHQHEDGSEEWMAFFKDPDDRPLAIMATIKP